MQWKERSLGKRKPGRSSNGARDKNKTNEIKRGTRTRNPTRSPLNQSHVTREILTECLVLRRRRREKGDSLRTPSPLKEEGHPLSHGRDGGRLAYTQDTRDSSQASGRYNRDESGDDKGGIAASPPRGNPPNRSDTTHSSCQGSAPW